MCWCWCSLLVPPLLFCVPRLVFLLSNFHPIFILISPSFPCHPHLHLTVGTSVFNPAWRGVCVWNIWTDVKLLLVLPAGGHSISLGLCPTKLPVKWDIQLGQLEVPAIFEFSVKWQPAKPTTGHLILLLHGFRNLPTISLLVIWMAIYALQSISECWTPDELFRSGPYSTFHTFSLGIPKITSKRTLYYLRLVWFCMHGIQFPTDPMMDHFLSSVWNPSNQLILRLTLTPASTWCFAHFH